MFLQCFWDSLIMCDYFRGCQPSVQSCDVCYVSLKSAWYVYIVFSGCLYNSGIDSSRVYQLHGLQGWGNLPVASVCFLGEPQDLYYFDDIVIAKGNSRYLKMPTIECLPIFIEMSRVNLWAQFLPMSNSMSLNVFLPERIEMSHQMSMHANHTVVPWKYQSDVNTGWVFLLFRPKND